MQSRTPHPVFLVCAVFAMLGALSAGITAIKATECDPSSGYSDSCNAQNQLKVDASIAIGLSSLVVLMAGLGFQLHQRDSSAPLPPPRPPVAVGPLPPGSVPPPGPVPPPYQPPSGPGQG